MTPDIISENHIQTLNFIISTLHRHKIKYQVTGGLAGNLYGSAWPLHDIDLEVAQKDMERVASLFRDCTIRPLARFVDEEFDLMLLTLRVGEVEVDINQAEDAFVFTKEGIRIQLDTDLSRAKEISFLGLTLYVQPLEELIKYKDLLGRKEDVLDLSRLR
ncbi:MAG: hypothetical protein KME26_16435 [Oscillatoria princeps RMCB-10]|jgi:hypothetical protein|nr:hypothetical protein [Oscillatoria princeps RMCB-10]